MASAPAYKVYDAQGTYQAACKEIAAAAVLMGFYGCGATIRLEHRIVLWTEGAEGQPAGESYDHVAEVAAQRLTERRAAHRAKAYRSAGMANVGGGAR